MLLNKAYCFDFELAGGLYFLRKFRLSMRLLGHLVQFDCEPASVRFKELVHELMFSFVALKWELQ